MNRIADTRSSNTIANHNKVIELFDKLVSEKEDSEYIAKTYFYIQVADQLNYQKGTVERIILKRNKYIKN